MATVKMMINVPVDVQEAKYLDIMPPGQYGSQFRLKGTIDGNPDSVMYLPGKVWAVRKALIEGGLIGDQELEEEPEKAVNVPLKVTTFSLLNKQVPGKTYGNIEVLGAPQPAPTNGAPKPSNGQPAGYMGPHIPEMDGPPAWLAAPEETIPEERPDVALVAKMAHLHRLCAKAWWSQVAPMYPKDLGLSPEAATAGIATLFIAVHNEMK